MPEALLGELEAERIRAGLEREHQAQAAHLHEPVGMALHERLQARPQPRAHLVDVRQQLRVLVALDHGLDHPRAELRAGEARRVEEGVLGEVGLDAIAEAAGGDRVDAGARALAGHEHVGHDAEVLEGPEAAGATEPRLHLVEDQQRAALVAEPAHLREVALRRAPDSRPWPGWSP